MRITDGLRVRPGDVISLVGGGGKTAVMFRLAEELTAAGLTVISTMTTKIFVGQMARAPASILQNSPPGQHGAVLNGSVSGEITELLVRHRHVLLGGQVRADREKLEGVPPEIVDQIAGTQLADVIIVEGDGSRRLPFKAPAEHEPVVPRSTTVLVPLVGLEVLGKPLDASHVHRPERVAALIRARPGEEISVATVARVLQHPQGGAKELPAGARFVPFLNKADLNMAGGRDLAHALLLGRTEGDQALVDNERVVVDEVVIGMAESAEPVCESWGRIAAVVLAAGEAKRFGALKQIMPWRGASPGMTAPLVAHVARQALACPDIGEVVVTKGARAELVEAALTQHLDGNEQVRQVVVPDWPEGQSRSVRAGLHAAQENARGRLSAAVFLLADQPGITPSLLSALVQRHRETHAPVVAPRYQGKRGNPVLFDRRTFSEFEGLEGDTGARSIIERYQPEIAWVDWPTDDILRDIDTWEDYTGAQTE